MKTLSHFKQIAAIPHCSFDAVKLKDYLVDFARAQGCEVKVDKVGNIHAYKGSPKVCLQAHYDMVCVGDAPKIELIEKDGWLSAKNSTLGADNGMGLAIAMSMMEEFSDIECLFSSDEEVGLIGANNCEFSIISPNLLNLDSENDSRVIIGCAASFMAEISKAVATKKASKKRLFLARAEGFLGGHSGIDIAKDIKSALVQMARFIRANDGELVSIKGGERTNSISVNATALFYADEITKQMPSIVCSEVEPKGEMVLEGVLDELLSFKHGVHEVDLEHNFVLASANLSLVDASKDGFKISIMARAASNELLDEMAYHIKAVFKEVNFTGRDEPWEPIESEFSKTVLKALQAHKPEAIATAIHAGLECGVFKARQNHLQCASIGPNICAPHSVHERCELASVEMIHAVTKEVLKQYQSN